MFTLLRHIYIFINQMISLKQTILLDSCVYISGNVTAHSSIQFVCDRQMGSDSAPIVLASMGCDVVFEWRTSIVCPTIEKPCSVVIDNHLFDLSILSKIRGAWNVTDKNKNM